MVGIPSLKCLVEEVPNIFQQLLFSTLVENNCFNMSFICHFRPCPGTVLVLINTGFILNKLGILGVALKEQSLKNLWRSTKVGNRDLFLTIKFSSLILASEYKQVVLVLHEKVSIPGRVI